MRTHKIQMALTVSLLGTVLDVRQPLFIFALNASDRGSPRRRAGRFVHAQIQRFRFRLGTDHIPSCTATIVNPAPGRRRFAFPILIRSGHHVTHSNARRCAAGLHILMDSVGRRRSTIQTFAASGTFAA